MTRYAYITTTAHNHPLGGATEAQSPQPPEGDDWELFLVSANETTRFHEWRRELVDAKAVAKK